MGGPHVGMSIIRNGNVALLILRKRHDALSIVKQALCCHIDFKKIPCHMSLRPKKGHVALSMLGVFTPRIILGRLVSRYTFYTLLTRKTSHRLQDWTV